MFGGRVGCGRLHFSRSHPLRYWRDTRTDTIVKEAPVIRGGTVQTATPIINTKPEREKKQMKADPDFFKKPPSGKGLGTRNLGSAPPKSVKGEGFATGGGPPRPPAAGAGPSGKGFFV